MTDLATSRASRVRQACRALGMPLCSCAGRGGEPCTQVADLLEEAARRGVSPVEAHARMEAETTGRAGMLPLRGPVAPTPRQGLLL